MSSLAESGPILVTGGSGQVGTSFRSLLPNALFPSRAQLDMSEPESLRTYVNAVRPSAIINCAAYTAVDRAEEEEELAAVVNGRSVGELAACAADLGALFVTYSTDYVFDGTSPDGYRESDTTNPINAYGRSKRLGEVGALDAHPDAVVIRTSWVVSGTHDNFIATMLRLGADAKRSLKVVDDQVGCPTIADDLARATLQAMDCGASGILHLSNPPPTTWFGFAAAAFEMAGLEPDVSPCGTDEFPTPASRPANSVLFSTRAGDFGVDPLPRWEDSLDSVVRAQMTRLGLSA